MQRRKYSFDHSDMVSRVERTKPKGIKNRSFKSLFKNKKKFKIFAISLAVVLIVGLGFEVYSFFNAANSMLGSNVTLNDLKGLVSASKSVLDQSEGRTNILVLGKGGDNHPGGQLTDTIQVIMINHADNRIAMVSLPRDLQIKTASGGINKLNSAYSSGYESEKDKTKKAEAGAKAASDKVSDILGVDIHYYITVDFIGFKDLVDSLGGVTVDVEKDLYDPYYPKDSFTSDGSYVKTDAYTTVSIKAGEQEMDGITALRYARSRETTSDFDRASRQQNLLYSIKEKALSLGVLANPQKVSNMLESIGNHIKMSFNLSELKELISFVNKMDKEKLITEVVDNNAKDGLLISTSEGGYYLKPKAGNNSQIQTMVKNIFSADEDADSAITSIEVLNASGTAGKAGKVAEILKAEGYEISNIDTYTEVVDTTVIENGGTDTSVANKIKSIVGIGSIKTYSQKGTLRVIIGKDYGK